MEEPGFVFGRLVKTALVFIAQGFGIGRVPYAPGTFGTALGFVLLGALLVPGSLPFFLCGIVVAVGVSVVACGEAEKALGQKDPGSVVVDEIVAVPVCCMGWFLLEWRRSGAFPGMWDVFSARRIWVLAGVFVLFRLFDIWKPWPVRGSQRLPGGWGVTVDDLLAAGYVNLVIVWFV